MAWSLSSILSFITLVLLQSSALAKDRGNITVGQSQTANINTSPWLSPLGDFAFGFQQFNKSNNLYLLAIWYAKIPDTIVWYANEVDPVPQGSTVTLTADQGLVLRDPQGTNLWNTSYTSSTAVISYGFMNDTGNFVLKGSGNDDTVWQSFGHPTDTLLPTQIMKIGQDSAVLYSRLSETNFKKGRFQLRLLADGNLVLNTRDIDNDFAYGAYYESGTNDAANPGIQVVYNESGYMYILQKNGSRVELLPQYKLVSSTDYHRATLDFDGVLTWYYHPRTTTSNGWSKLMQIPENICMTIATYGGDFNSGACGYNSICSLDADKRPKCECPPNYSLLDPNDMYGSCKPDFILDECERNGQSTMKGEYKLVQLLNTNWPQADYAAIEPSNVEDCKSSCLNDCFCAAAIFNGDKTCWKKKLPLSNGRQDTSVIGTAYLKVGQGNYSTNLLNPSVPTPKENNKKDTVFSVLLGGSVFVNFCLLSAIALGVYFIYRKKQFKWLDGGQNRTLMEYSYVTSFSYRELQEATNSFKEEIGRGAFGVVYKGTIAAGGPKFFVAVKKLDRISKDADKEFQTEVNVIGQTHHKHLVRLVGFCKEEDQRLLVYEYMSNGTIADFLFDDLKPSWAARSQIAQGIARGLLYLHEECSTQIIHCDIKPQNILLDDCHNARISDFGLAKLLVLNQSQTKTAIRGTKGYVAPEWFRNKPVTVKVDVYSFGVLLLEIICCRKNVCSEITAEEEIILTDWAFDCYQSGTLDSLLNDDMEALNDRRQFERFVMVALWRIQEDPSLRPTMRLVTLMLEGLAEVAMPPCASSFTISTQY